MKAKRKKTSMGKFDRFIYMFNLLFKIAFITVIDVIVINRLVIIVVFFCGTDLA